MIENRHLNYFLVLAREGNFTLAAEALGITQPTLSKQIQDLEDNLGKKLLHRGNRKITLTPDGEFLRSRAEEILSLMTGTEEAMKQRPESVSGEISFGCGETAIMAGITQKMAEFRAKNPGVRFNIFSGDRESVLEKLDKGLLDFGLILGPVPEERYDLLPLPYHDTFGLLMRRDDPLAAQDSISQNELRKLPLIVSRQMHLPKAHIVATYNLIHNATYMVEAGMGYALCLDRLVNTNVIRDLAFRPFVPEMPLPATIVTKRFREFSPAAGLFNELLLECFTKKA